MSILTFGGKSVHTIRAGAAPAGTTVDTVNCDARSQVVLFMRLVAMALETRRALVAAVETLQEINVNALNEPTLADHPRRPAMERLYQDARKAEHLAVVRLAELNVSLARTWNQIQASDKNRFALTDLIGADPEQDPLLVLWSDTCGLAKLVPFPDGWAVPHDLSHRVLDPSIEVREYIAEELLSAECAPF